MTARSLNARRSHWPERKNSAISGGVFAVGCGSASIETCTKLVSNPIVSVAFSRDQQLGPLKPAGSDLDKHAAGDRQDGITEIIPWIVQIGAVLAVADKKEAP